MYGSAFYKLSARNRLRGNYKSSFIASLICVIPGIILSSAVFLLSRSAAVIMLPVLSALFNIFIINILDVGYTRFLMRLPEEGQTEQDSNALSGGRADYNILLSGYTMNFANTVKVMFIRLLYEFLWSLLMLIPVLVYTGILMLLMTVSPQYARLAGYIEMLVTSPSSQMINIIASHIILHCPAIIILSMLTFIGMIFCASVSIRKSYEYAMIPMILAEDPDISVRRAFRRTRDIMTGFKMRLFLLQLSFIGYTFLIMLVTAMLPFAPTVYIASAAVMPYKQMASIQFYTERRSVLDYNISKYGEHTD